MKRYACIFLSIICAACTATTLYICVTKGMSSEDLAPLFPALGAALSGVATVIASES